MQHPRPIGPINNIDAPQSVEMIQGVRPPQHRYRAPFHQGFLAQTPDVPVFSIEMVAGSKPDRPRIFLGPRIPLPVSQTTPVAAPLSIEMTAGSAPTRNRAFVFPKIGWSVSQTTHDSATFSIEMTQGAAQPRFRYRAPFHQGAQWWTPEVEVFDIASVIGSKPDRHRQRLGPRIGQPVSQTTHTAAPFSIEMVIGSVPLQSRQRNDIRMRSGWSLPPNPGPDVTPVTEVTSGPHRFLWMPSHLHTVIWDEHARLFVWTFHWRGN